MYLLEQRYKKAKDLLDFFYSHQEDLEMYDKKESFYLNKMKLFTAYLHTRHKKTTK